MKLPQRCLIWIMIVAMFSVFGAVGMVALTIAKLNGQAATMRTELAVSFLRTKLDGNAVSARSLALIAEDLLPGFNQRLVIAVFDPTGVVVAASRSDLVGDPAPRSLAVGLPWHLCLRDLDFGSEWSGDRWACGRGSCLIIALDITAPRIGFWMASAVPSCFLSGLLVRYATNHGGTWPRCCGQHRFIPCPPQNGQDAAGRDGGCRR